MSGKSQQKQSEFIRTSLQRACKRNVNYSEVISQRKISKSRLLNLANHASPNDKAVGNVTFTHLRNGIVACLNHSTRVVICDQHKASHLYAYPQFINKTNNSASPHGHNSRCNEFTKVKYEECGIFNNLNLRVSKDLKSNGKITSRGIIKSQSLNAEWKRKSCNSTPSNNETYINKVKYDQRLHQDDRRSKNICKNNLESIPPSKDVFSKSKRKPINKRVKSCLTKITDKKNAKNAKSKYKDVPKAKVQKSRMYIEDVFESTPLRLAQSRVKSKSNEWAKMTDDSFFASDVATPFNDAKLSQHPYVRVFCLRKSPAVEITNNETICQKKNPPKGRSQNADSAKSKESQCRPTVLASKPGTLAHKAYIRQVLTDMNREYVEDVYESTPLRANRSQLTVSAFETLNDDSFFGNKLPFDTPKESNTPLIRMLREPVANVASPAPSELESSFDIRRNDRYVLKLKKPKRNLTMQNSRISSVDKSGNTPTKNTRLHLPIFSSDPCTELNDTFQDHYFSDCD